MAGKKDNEKKDQKDEKQAQAEEMQSHEVRFQTPSEDDNPAAQNFVEADAPKEDDKVRAAATPEDEQLPEGLDNLPEPDSVGMLEYLVNPDPVAEAEKQQAENFPRVTEFDFDPANHSVEEARPGRAATSRAIVGRVVIVEHDLIHDGEVYKAGVQDLPQDVADALISEGEAFEPAGKKRGR